MKGSKFFFFSFHDKSFLGNSKLQLLFFFFLLEEKMEEAAFIYTGLVIKACGPRPSYEAEISDLSNLLIIFLLFIAFHIQYFELIIFCFLTN